MLRYVCICVSFNMRLARLEVVKADRARRGPDHQDADHETEVAEAIGDERLVRPPRTPRRA